jgi:hypothetical protein
VIQLLKEFVPAVGAPQEFREAKKNELEYKLVFGAMNKTEFGGDNGMDHWHVQGLYVITPSGRLLAGSNNVSDPLETLRHMHKGLELYRKLPKKDRLLPQPPDPRKDRVARNFAGARPPEGGLELRVVTRGLTAAGIRVEEDTRHPFYYKLDRLWYKKDEARGFVPPVLRVGARAPVPRPLVERLVTFNLGTNYEPTFYWHMEDIRELAFTTEVVKVTDAAVEVRLEGRAKLGAKDPYVRTYEPDLLGKATYDRKTGRFSAFELLAVGRHTRGRAGDDQPGPPASTLGIYFTLDGHNVNDRMVPSYYWLYGWEP